MTIRGLDMVLIHGIATVANLKKYTHLMIECHSCHVSANTDYRDGDSIAHSLKEENL